MKRITLSMMTFSLLLLCAHNSFSEQKAAATESTAQPTTADASTAALNKAGVQFTNTVAQVSSWPGGKKRWLL